MTHSNTTTVTDFGTTVTRTRHWSYSTVRHACIKNDLYTRGCNKDYAAMLEFVDSSEPTTKALYTVASDIYMHSKNQTISNIMYILESDAVITTFEIDGSDEI